MANEFFPQVLQSLKYIYLIKLATRHETIIKQKLILYNYYKTIGTLELSQYNYRELFYAHYS